MNIREGYRYLKANGAIGSKIVKTDEPNINYPEHIFQDGDNYELYRADGMFLTTYESSKDLILEIDEGWYKMFLEIMYKQAVDGNWTRDFAQFLYEKCPAEAEGLRGELHYWTKEDR